MKKKITAALTAIAVLLNIFLCAGFTKADSAFAGIESVESVLNGGYVSLTSESGGVSCGVMDGIKGAGVLPESYSSVSEGYTSGVKNQNPTSICWAFSQNEVLETFMAKDTGIHYDLSEENMKFETSYSTNKTGGFDRTPNGGGNEYMSTAYLASGGTALEEDEPFTDSVVRKVQSSDVERFGYLKNAPMYTGQNGYDAEAVLRIKELVYEYGAVGSGIYFDDLYENTRRTCYYYNGGYTSSNHAVTIVGWDDSYSASNFRYRPQGDGAFLIKNSWGQYHNNGKDDLMYVSYYDKCINAHFFTSEFYAENDVFDHIYQYDYLGHVTNGYLIGKKSVVCAVKFDSYYYEAVNSVSTYTTLENVAVKIYVDPDGGDAGDKSGYVYAGMYVFKHPGYHMIDIDPVRVTGSGFTVAVEYIMPEGAANAYFPLQSKLSNYSEHIKNKPNTCYFGTDFSMLYSLEYVYQSYDPMLCIKAFTEDTCSKDNHFYTEKYDKNGHWQECICGLTKQYSEHTFDSDCDMKCNGCSYTRAVTHSYDIKNDSKNHWHECRTCGAAIDISAHIYDNSFDNTCNFCTYRRNAPNTPTKTFADVKSTQWYKYYVDYAVAYGMFKGTGNTTFEPDGEMTRAQFVQVLANLSGSKLNNKVSSGFTDVLSGEWYTGAVKWASENKIVAGMGNGRFEPDTKIDRQQMCVMLVNYVEKYKKTALKQKRSYTVFADEKSIESWAKTAVIKCYKAGLVSGVGNNSFSPSSIATRKEGAAIFTNFHKEYIAN